MGVTKEEGGYNEAMGITTDNLALPDGGSIAATKTIRVVGFALLLAWFSASGFLSSSVSAEHADFLTLTAFTVLLFLIALCNRSQKDARRPEAFYLISGSAAAIGTIVPTFADGNPAINIGCPLLAAPGLALLVIGWGSVFCRSGMAAVISETIAAQLLMSIIHLLGCLLPPHPEALLRGVYLIGSALMLIAAERSAASKTSFSAEKKRDRRRAPAKWHPFVRFIIAINLWGAAINQLYNIYRYCAPLDFADLSAPAALVETVFLGLLLAVASMRKVKDVQLYTIIFVTVLLAFLLVPVLGIGSAAPFYALFLGFAALSVLTWTLSAQICQEYHFSPTVVYGCAIGSFLGLQIVIARAVAQDALSEIASSPIELNTICLVAALASFAAYQLVFNRKSAIWSKPKGDGSIQLFGASDNEGCSGEIDQTVDPFEQWGSFAELYRLTPRESEVLLLFARGRSYERIQGTLTISRGTVNYHMSNAYRKIGISSRQELLDRLDAAARSAEAD